MDGFIVVDKPKGITSLSAVNKIKYSLGLNKCGHSGTLDPNATGVLLIATDKATKLIDLVNSDEKEYITTIVFGLDSETLDVDGTITNDIKMDVKLDDIISAMKVLKAQTMQLPPMTSAIKINGKKLYEYQRKGIEIEVQKRNVIVIDDQILSDLRYVDNHYEIDIRLHVSKGFYIRSYARDLGQLLGGCAIVKELRRIRCGSITLDMAKSLDKANIDDIIPIEEFFDLPKVEVSDYMVKLVKNGVTLDERQTTIDSCFYVTNKCDIIAIYKKVGINTYKPILIF